MSNETPQEDEEGVDTLTDQEDVPTKELPERRAPQTTRIKRFDPVTRSYRTSEVDLSDRRFGSNRYYTNDGKLITGEGL